MEVDCGEMKKKRGRRVKERLKVKRKKMEELRKYRCDVDMLLSRDWKNEKKSRRGNEDPGKSQA